MLRGAARNLVPLPTGSDLFRPCTSAPDVGQRRVSPGSLPPAGGPVGAINRHSPALPSGAPELAGTHKPQGSDRPRSHFLSAPTLVSRGPLFRVGHLRAAPGDAQGSSRLRTQESLLAACSRGHHSLSHPSTACGPDTTRCGFRSQTQAWAPSCCGTGSSNKTQPSQAKFIPKGWRWQARGRERAQACVGSPTPPCPVPPTPKDSHQEQHPGK